MKPQLLNVTQAAVIANVSRQTIKNWIKSGIIKAYKLHNSWYIHRQTFMECYNALNTVESTKGKVASLQAEYDLCLKTLQQSIGEANQKLEGSEATVINAVNKRATTLMVELLSDICMSKQNHKIIASILNGESIENICSRYQLTSRQVMLIAKRAGSSLSRLRTYHDLVNENNDLKKRTAYLMAALKVQQKKVDVLTERLSKQ